MYILMIGQLTILSVLFEYFVAICECVLFRSILCSILLYLNWTLCIQFISLELICKQFAWTQISYDLEVCVQSDVPSMQFLEVLEFHVAVG